MAKADGLVTCDPASGTPCTINDFFNMLGKIYKFIVVDLATPLALIAIVVGAVYMMASAGNPGMMGKGKQILTYAIIGLILAYGSYMIINEILKWVGFSGSWSSPF